MALSVPSSDIGDTFPEFSDGNVIIIIAPGYQLKLHTDHLKRSAERFKKLFIEDATSAQQVGAVHGALSRFTPINEEPVAPPRKKRAKKVDATYYLVLQGVNENDLQNYPGVLTPTTQDIVMKSSAFLAGNANAKIEPRYVRLWYNVLGSFYNASLRFDQTDLATLLIDTHGMEAIANWLGCVPVLSHRIEHALLGQGDALWRAILNNPAAWIDLAWKLGAKEIYKEALIHLAGLFYRLTDDERGAIPSVVLPKVKEKANVLEQFKANVDFRLATWLSPDLKPPSTIDGTTSAKDHGRVAYADNIYIWVAQHLFDHFLKFAFQNRDNRGAPDGGYAFYECIFKTDYLLKEDQDKFHSRDCPMTPKGQRVLYNCLTDLKIHVKDVVRPLFTNAARIDREKEKLMYFTCVPIFDKDLDWLLEAKGWNLEQSLEEGDEAMSEEDN